jgi:replicative DNA helicase
MVKESTKKQYDPPQSADAEQSVLGALLKDPKAFHTIADFFHTPTYFYYPANQMVFKAIMNLYERNEVIDLTAVANELTGMNQLEKIGGRLRLIELIDGCASTANIAGYANIVVEKYNLRELINTCSDAISSCYEQSAPVTNLLDRIEADIFRISQARVRKGFVPLSEALPGTFDELERYSKNEGKVTGLPTGFFDLDKKLSGLHGGEFIVIAGRPSMGKTAIALNIAEYVALTEKKPVGIFSLEMSLKQISMRFLCSRARVNQHNMRSGIINDSDWKLLTASSGPLSEAKIFIDDSANLSTMEFRAKARQLKSQQNIGLFVVDYVQLMTCSHRTDNRQQEVTEISATIKAMAKEMDVPIIAVCQLSRKVEERSKEARPQLSDIRESGAIEQDADVVMFVYRPEYYLTEKEKGTAKYYSITGQAEVIIGKNRNGPIGTIPLAWLKDMIRFENCAQKEAVSEPELEDEQRDIPF